MKKHFTQGFSIALLLTLIIFSDPLGPKGISAVPCRPMPEVCPPETEFPPCQPSVCLGADTPQTPRVANR